MNVDQRKFDVGEDDIMALDSSVLNSWLSQENGFKKSSYKS
jgi:hypothetical protein